MKKIFLNGAINVLTGVKHVVKGEYFTKPSINTRKDFSPATIDKTTLLIITVLLVQVVLIFSLLGGVNKVEQEVEANITVELPASVQIDMNNTDDNITVELPASVQIDMNNTDDNMSVKVAKALAEIDPIVVPVIKPVKKTAVKLASVKKKHIAKKPKTKKKPCKTCVAKIPKVKKKHVSNLPVEQMVPTVKEIKKQLNVRGDDPVLIKKVIEGYSRKNVNAIFKAFKSSSNQFGASTPQDINSRDFKGVFYG
jgi:hypothetical protein